MFSFRRLLKSFRYAFQGIAYALKHEQNFRAEIVAGLAVLALGLWYQIGNVRMVLLVMLVTMVLAAELLNTFFEKMIDLLSPRVHQYAAMLKDILAALVFVTALGSVVAGLLIFWPFFGSFGN